MSDTKLGRLEQSLQLEIKRFDREATRHKRMFRGLRYSAIWLTFAGTVLASANLVFTNTGSFLSFLVVVVTAVACVIATMEAIKNPMESWILEKAVVQSLNDLQREVEFYGDALDDQQLGEIFTRMQAVLFTSRQQWRDSTIDGAHHSSIANRPEE